MSERYALVNAEGVSENVILWDGEAEWSPPEGLQLVPADSPEGQAAIAAAEEIARVRNEAARAAYLASLPRL